MRVADVLKLAGIQGKSIEDAVEAIMDNVSMNIDEAPWLMLYGIPTRQPSKAAKSREDCSFHLSALRLD